MDFSDLVSLTEYWNESPTLTMMMQAYLGVEKTISATDPMAMAEAMRAMGMRGKAAKVATAPDRDREIFRSLQEQATKLKGGGRTI